MTSVFGAHLRKTVSSLTVPQGYTLSIAGTLAVAGHRYGPPTLVEGWFFVLGAVVVFLALAAFSVRDGSRSPDTVVTSGRLAFNAVPLASMAAGAGTSCAIPWSPVGYPAAGIVAVLAYVLLVAIFSAWIAGPPASPRHPSEGASK